MKRKSTKLRAFETLEAKKLLTADMGVDARCDVETQLVGSIQTDSDSQTRDDSGKDVLLFVDNIFRSTDADGGKAADMDIVRENRNDDVAAKVEGPTLVAYGNPLDIISEYPNDDDSEVQGPGIQEDVTDIVLNSHPGDADGDGVTDFKDSRASRDQYLPISSAYA